MTVTVAVPTQALADATVHRALERLIDALARHTARRTGASPGSAPAPGPALPAGDRDARYAAFLGALPERSRAFLDLVEAAGTLTIHDAMAQLQVVRGKAMGGITGSIARWAPEYGVTVPFEAVRGPDGRRAWRWIGLDREPAPPVPVRRQRRRRRAEAASIAPAVAPVRAATPSSRPPMVWPPSVPPPKVPPPAPAAAPGAALSEALATLDDDAAQFLRLLATRGHLSRREALKALGLARAQGLKPVVEAVEAALAGVDLTSRLHRTVDDLGEMGWRWGERESEGPADVAPPALTATAGEGVRVRKSPHP